MTVGQIQTEQVVLGVQIDAFSDDKRCTREITRLGGTPQRLTRFCVKCVDMTPLTACKENGASFLVMREDKA